MNLDATSVKILLEVFIIGIFTVFGSGTKIYLKILQYPNLKKSVKENLVEAILSAVFSFLLVYAISDYIQEKLGFKALMFASYTAGMIGFEILMKFCSLKNLMKFLGNILTLYNNYQKLDNENENDLFNKAKNSEKEKQESKNK